MGAGAADASNCYVLENKYLFGHAAERTHTHTQKRIHMHTETHAHAHQHHVPRERTFCRHTSCHAIWPGNLQPSAAASHLRFVSAGAPVANNMNSQCFPAYSLEAVYVFQTANSVCIRFGSVACGIGCCNSISPNNMPTVGSLTMYTCGRPYHISMDC